MRERAWIILGLAISGVALALVAGLAGSIISRAPAKLSRAEAERLLRSSDFMGDTATTRLVLYRNRIFPAADLLAEYREMVKFIDLGLVEVRPDGFFWGRPLGAKFMLTLEGERAAASGWRSTSGPQGEEAWLVTTARKELVQVREPVTREGTADCKFVWKWVPTKIGDKAGGPKGSETAGARFYLEDKQWYLDEGSIVQLAGK